jgi:hypothetical protein
MKNLCVEKMELGPIATNAFVLWEEHGNGEAVLIDAPPFARETVQQVWIGKSSSSRRSG